MLDHKQYEYISTEDYLKKLTSVHVGPVFSEFSLLFGELINKVKSVLYEIYDSKSDLNSQGQP